MNLDELSRKTQGLTEAKFRAAYSHPALVFLPSSYDERKALFDTHVDEKQAMYARTLAKSRAREDPSTVDTELEGVRPPQENVTGRSAVLFLAKSERNPFSDMVTVGRAANNDVVLQAPTVSKMHAYFRSTSSGWSLADNRATNGTFVDEIRLAAGTSAPLSDGARVGFAEVRAKFFTPQGLFGFLALYRKGLE
jgi:hypothetical protein